MAQPAYQQVAAVLRSEIEQGRWQAGERIPTQQELCERFGVSRNTARNAVEMLIRENLVFSQTSRGTVVRDRRALDHVVTRPLRPDRPGSGYDIFVETAHQADREASKEFSFGIELPQNWAKHRLGITEETLAVRREIMQYLNGEPWSWEITYYPRGLAELTGVDTPHDIAEGTTRRIADHGYAEIGWIDEHHSYPATPEEAHALTIPIGTWITSQVRTGATTDQVTRVTCTRRIAERNRLVYEMGEDTALERIYTARSSSAA